jgi:hypothetical protein
VFPVPVLLSEQSKQSHRRFGDSVGLGFRSRGGGSNQVEGKSVYFAYTVLRTMTQGLGGLSAVLVGTWTVPKDIRQFLSMGTNHYGGPDWELVRKVTSSSELGPAHGQPVHVLVS